MSAAGLASAEELAGQVSAQVLVEVLAPVLVPRLVVVHNSNMALGIALASYQRTTSSRCRHCTKGSQSSPSAYCSCQQLQESEQKSVGQAWDSAQA